MTVGNSKNHKDNLIRTAIRLFRRQGYATTGLNELLKVSKIPKGSLYHYFPGGKEELGAAAVKAAGETVLKTLLDLEEKTGSSDEFLTLYGDMLANWVEMSGYRDGCPISTTLLEMTPHSQLISTAGNAAFFSWREVITRVFKRDGWTQAAASQRATLVISAIQGALLLSRVEQSHVPLQTIRDLARA